MKIEKPLTDRFIKDAAINREYSWLLFNNRVLDQALDLTNPLLERCKFLSIFKSNLDEFTMVRLGSLENDDKSQKAKQEEITGLTPHEQIEGILSMYPSFYKDIDHTWSFLKDDLSGKGMNILKGSELSLRQREACEKHFNEYLLPRVSPLVLDQKHPLIKFQNLRTYMVLLLEREGREMFGVATISPQVERIYQIPGGRKINLILSEELLLTFGETAFPGYTVKDKALIRITRNADFEASMDEADMEYDYDFSRYMKMKIEERGSLNPVRLEMNSNSEELKAYISRQVGLKRNRIFISNSYFDFKFLFKIASFFPEDARKKLSYKPFSGHVDETLKNGSIIRTLEKKDLFLSYPFDALDPLLKLLDEAATDPTVTNIKITIYRLATHSKIAAALLKAAENGKEVTAVMELCARFDEENNMYYADRLRDAGCMVFYGMGDYKVHSKIISIVREINGRISYITHIGTGNYNEGTSCQYTDLNLLTTNQEIGEDGAAFFRNLAVQNIECSYRHLLVAPYSLKKGLCEEIDREIAKGPDGLILAKMNSLTDKLMIEKFIEASQAGVDIHLVVRGICCLCPGIPGKTENIHIRSIVGRFLEHSRIYAFGKGEDTRVYIGSADLMTRNLDKRVEIAVRVLDEDVKTKVLHIMTTLLEDNVKARRLEQDATYRRIESLSDPIDSQAVFLSEAKSYIE